MENMIRTISLVVTPLAIQGYKGEDLARESLESLAELEEVDLNDPLVAAIADQFITGAIQAVEVAEDVALNA